MGLGQCQLLGDRFGFFIQLLLASLSFSTLIIKRFSEKPMRSWRRWARDASKQCAGQLVGHAWNILYAQLLVSTNFANPCVFYFVQFILADNVLGIALNFVVLRLVEWTAARYLRTKVLESGNYGDGHSSSNAIWILQIFVWLLIISAVKAVLFFTFLSPFRHALYALGEFTLGPLRLHPRIELVVVMIIIPMIVNALQFWVTDSYLQHNRSSPSWLPSTPAVGASRSKRGGAHAGDYATYTSSTNVRKSSRAVGPPLGHQSLTSITSSNHRTNGHNASGGITNGHHNHHDGSSDSEHSEHAHTHAHGGHAHAHGYDHNDEQVDHGSLTDDASLVFSRDSDISMALPASAEVPLLSHTRQSSIDGTTTTGNYSDTGNTSA